MNRAMTMETKSMKLRAKASGRVTSRLALPRARFMWKKKPSCTITALHGWVRPGFRAHHVSMS